MKQEFRDNLLDVLIKDTYPQYKANGKRSTRKLIGVHSFLGNFLKDYFSSVSGIEVSWNAGDEVNKEANVPGAMYDKKIDITVFKDKNPVLCLGFKFPCSNYKQNSINYIETMVGETYNIQRNGIPYFHILVLPAVMPYCDKNGDVKRNDKITEKDIGKYLILSGDNDFGAPHHMLIFLIDFDDTYDTIIGYSDPKKVFISKKMEYENFADKFSSTFAIDKFFDKLDCIKKKLIEADNG